MNKPFGREHTTLGNVATITIGRIFSTYDPSWDDPPSWRGCAPSWVADKLEQAVRKSSGSTSAAPPSVSKGFCMKIIEKSSQIHIPYKSTIHVGKYTGSMDNVSSSSDLKMKTPGVLAVGGLQLLTLCLRI